MKTIKEMTVVELKAIAFDQLVNIETAQANIKAINEELNLRKNNPVEVETVKEEDISE